MQNRRLRGLYVITDPELCKENIVSMVEQAILGGAQIVQYRNKMASPQQKQQEASLLKEICHRHQRLFIINDDVELAKNVDADGVHIGQADTALKQARESLGHEKIIGVTCNNQLDWAVMAQLQGADYIALGRFYDSHTKPGAPKAPIELLIQAKQQLDVPVVAIGGITAENAHELVNTGVDMLAVIHAIFSQDDISHASQQIQQYFN